ncbi:Protein YzbB [hydrothermal vent metagenome]|uniref:Protein YzbB n=1 Tax=hydrothermal vent metagenome TaxID=652676 RepID=A0A3B1CH11_9ZZZZ
MNHVITGLDLLLADPERYLEGQQSIGLVVNQTSVAGDHQHSITHFKNHSWFKLKKIFAPEHGLYGIDQDMAKVNDCQDPCSGLHVLSLYGDQANSLSPKLEHLAEIENLVFDIQDVGSRYYTFIYTLANCMEVCREAGVRMVVCDRPNPINGLSVEGNLVGENFRSFVGQYPIANRHGMTVGELAKMFNTTFGINCDLTVIPMRGWDRAMWYDQTGIGWIPTSPNMPTLATATVYPGMCLIEGTKLSEGRGTTLPFELVGAPYIDAHKLADQLQKEHLPGVIFRPQYFKPMFQKWCRETCGGVQLHITDRDQFKPLLTGIAVIRAIHQLYPRQFDWRTEAYEFVNDRLAIDILYGNPDFRENLLANNDSLETIESSWNDDLSDFKSRRQEFLIY